MRYSIFFTVQGKIKTAMRKRSFNGFLPSKDLSDDILLQYDTDKIIFSLVADLLQGFLHFDL